MKCKKCKFKDNKTDRCMYPFKVSAVGDTKMDKDGKIIGCSYGMK